MPNWLLHPFGPLSGKILASLGLLAAMTGCGLLYYFGLPSDVDPTGAITIITSNRDPAAIAKGKRYRLWGRIGILLVGVGSGLQLWAAWAA